MHSFYPKQKPLSPPRATFAYPYVEDQLRPYEEKNYASAAVLPIITLVYLLINNNNNIIIHNASCSQRLLWFLINTRLCKTVLSVQTVCGASLTVLMI